MNTLSLARKVGGNSCVYQKKLPIRVSSHGGELGNVRGREGETDDWDDQRTVLRMHVSSHDWFLQESSFERMTRSHGFASEGCKRCTLTTCIKSTTQHDLYPTMTALASVDIVRGELKPGNWL